MPATGGRVLYSLSKISAPLLNNRYRVPFNTLRLLMSFSMWYCTLRISSSFSFISFTTWKWSNTCTAFGQFSYTEEMKAAERSVAIYLMPTPFLLIRFQKPSRASAPLPLPVYSFKGGRRVMVFKMTRMDILDGIPGYAQEIGRVFQGHAP